LWPSPFRHGRREGDGTEREKVTLLQSDGGVGREPRLSDSCRLGYTLFSFSFLVSFLPFIPPSLPSLSLLPPSFLVILGFELHVLCLLGRRYIHFNFFKVYTHFKVNVKEFFDFFF
jgi:hypothetical protein